MTKAVAAALLMVLALQPSFASPADRATTGSLQAAESQEAETNNCTDEHGNHECPV